MLDEEYDARDAAEVPEDEAEDLSQLPRDMFHSNLYGCLSITAGVNDDDATAIRMFCTWARMCLDEAEAEFLEGD